MDPSLSHNREGCQPFSGGAGLHRAKSENKTAAENAYQGIQTSNPMHFNGVQGLQPSSHEYLNSWQPYQNHQQDAMYSTGMAQETPYTTALPHTPFLGAGGSSTFDMTYVSQSENFANQPPQTITNGDASSSATHVPLQFGYSSSLMPDEQNVCAPEGFHQGQQDLQSGVPPDYDDVSHRQDPWSGERPAEVPSFDHPDAYVPQYAQHQPPMPLLSSSQPLHAPTPVPETSSFETLKSQYPSHIREIFTHVAHGQLPAAADLLLKVSNFLLHNVERMSLEKDYEELHDARIKMWDDFNNCWLTLVKKLYDMSKPSARDQDSAPTTTELLSVPTMKHLGNELVRHCNRLEKLGLVDYQMGVAEDLIITQLIKCIKFVSPDDAEAPSLRDKTPERRKGGST